MEKTIELRDLTVGYGSRILIEHADAAVAAGKLVALLGRNGSGKSSLLRVLAGIDRPVAGEVLVKGTPLNKLSVPEKARLISFVLTDRVRIANLKCRDLVGLGRAPYTDWIGKLTDEDKDIVMRSMRLVGMEGYADKTMDRMSDGECQRVMIARALAQDTPIILLDEPTSFLDLPNRFELCSLLRRLAHDEGKSIIFSTHELDIATRFCDAIMLIDSPHLRFLPTPEMLTANHISRLFHLEQGTGPAECLGN